jgi:uncharacterized protein
MRLEVGYGLEARIPDAVARTLLDGTRSSLRAARYADAIGAVIDGVSARAKGLDVGEPPRALVELPLHARYPVLWGVGAIAALVVSRLRRKRRGEEHPRAPPPPKKKRKKRRRRARRPSDDDARDEPQVRWTGFFGDVGLSLVPGAVVACVVGPTVAHALAFFAVTSVASLATIVALRFDERDTARLRKSGGIYWFATFVLLSLVAGVATHEEPDGLIPAYELHVALASGLFIGGKILILFVKGIFSPTRGGSSWRASSSSSSWSSSSSSSWGGSSSSWSSSSFSSSSSSSSWDGGGGSFGGGGASSSW